MVSLLALGEAPVAAHPVVAEGLAGTLALVQALGDAGTGARLWVVTRGAVAAGAGEVPVSLAGAQVWGLGRVAALEHPHRWGGLVDLPAQFAERAGRRLCEVLAGGSGEDQVAIRDRGVLARRLVRAPHGEAAAGPGGGAQRGGPTDGPGHRRDRGAGRARGPVAGRPGAGSWCWPRGAARPPPARRRWRPNWPPPGRP